MDDIIYDIAFSFDESITPIEKSTLFNNYGFSKNILDLKRNTIKNILGRRWSGNSFNAGELIKKAEKVYNYIIRSNIKVIRFDSPEFPEGLKQIPDFPFLIYCKGNIDFDFEKSAAIVGTRKPSFFGFKKTEDFASYFTEKGFTIVSGLALGVDAKAHEISLLKKGKTIAVLGSGIDKIYPAGNKELAKMILENNGAIISEYPPGVLPKKWNFPKRNRIIVGLWKYVLITEAPSRSGSLISAFLAADYNRELFVVSPENDLSLYNAGNRELIFSGATEVRNPEELLK